MKKKILISLLAIIALFFVTGCNNNEDKSSSKSNQENQQEIIEDEEQEEKLSKDYNGFDLEQMKPNKGGEEYNEDIEVENVLYGKLMARYYGEYIGRMPSYDEETVYARKVFSYCKSIASDGKVYQSVGGMGNPNNSDVKEVKSEKEAEEISNTYTWSIKLNGHWYVVTIAGEKNRTNASMGVRILQLASYK